MEDSRAKRMQEVESLNRKPDELWTLLKQRVRAFRETLDSYLIPEEGIEKYVSMFMRERQDVINRYTQGRMEEMKHEKYPWRFFVEIAVLDSTSPGELRLEELTPLEREYLRDMLETHTELLQKASEEYLK